MWNEVEQDGEEEQEEKGGGEGRKDPEKKTKTIVSEDPRGNNFHSNLALCHSPICLLPVQLYFFRAEKQRRENRGINRQESERFLSQSLLPFPLSSSVHRNSRTVFLHFSCRRDEAASSLLGITRTNTSCLS